MINDPASSWAAANLKRNLRAQAHLAGQLGVEDPQPRKRKQKIPQPCHYCGQQALTRDHIVPKAYLDQWWPRRRTRPQMNNLVPACAICNVIKADYRSDCRCEMCTAAWEIVFKSEAPPSVEIMPVMLIAQFRNGFWKGKSMDKITMFDGVIDQLDYDENRMLRKIHMSDGHGRIWTLTITSSQGLEQSLAAGQNKVAFMDRRPKVEIEGEFG